jgi:hypothetical protein
LEIRDHKKIKRHTDDYFAGPAGGGTTLPSSLGASLESRTKGCVVGRREREREERRREVSKEKKKDKRKEKKKEKKKERQRTRKVRPPM